jgi:pimeloyl-ACP methyl ester carboxylesterase
VLTGYFTASYVSSIDDSEQPFALWVPRTYSPARKYPLIVALHGSDADHRMIPEQCFHMHERGFREDVIFLSPFGRGDVNYQWMGEADMWDTINWVKARYCIDARRQYLTGLSMGGFATWRLACSYPSQWAAIAPICGGGDLRALPALKNVAVWCVHGDADAFVPVDQSRRLVAKLKRLRLRHRYSELPGWGHSSWEWLYNPDRQADSLVDWLLSFRKRAVPRPIHKPRRHGTFGDLFRERVIISYPARTPVPNEAALLRAEAVQLAGFSFGDRAMRSGRLIVKSDADLTRADLAKANHLMLGRADNHRWLKRAAPNLVARHRSGRLEVQGVVFTKKNMVVAALQRSPWSPKRLLGLITYQQREQIRGLVERLFHHETPLPPVLLYDTTGERFIPVPRHDRP